MQILRRSPRRFRQTFRTTWYKKKIRLYCKWNDALILLITDLSFSLLTAQRIWICASPNRGFRFWTFKSRWILWAINTTHNLLLQSVPSVHASAGEQSHPHGPPRGTISTDGRAGGLACLKMRYTVFSLWRRIRFTVFGWFGANFLHVFTVENC